MFFSIALHVAILVALTLTFHWPLSVRMTAAPAPIQGFAVDPSVLKAEQQRKDQEVQRKQKEERDKREAAEQKQREKEAADKRERDRLAEQQRVKEQQDREKAEAAKAAQEKAAKAAQEKAAQEAREKQAKADAARKQKEAKEQAQLDAETQKEAALEAARMAAERSGAMADYILQIQNQIERNWAKPLSAQPGLECRINVVQLLTGDVVEAKVDQNHCNGDEAVRRSIQDAVQKASPLPKPPSQAMYERNLIVTFKPDLDHQ